MRNVVFRGQALVLLAAVLSTLGLRAAAQEASSEKSPKEGKLAAATKPVAVYRVDYTIREMEDGKVLNSRKYMLMAESDGRAQSRVGNRVPITLEKGPTYDNVGMNIDCHVRERDDVILLGTRIEFSSVVPPEQAPTPSVNYPNPVFRSVSSDVTAAVSLGKPTLIGSMDDVTSNRRFEIEATVTKVK